MGLFNQVISGLRFILKAYQIQSASLLSLAFTDFLQETKELGHVGAETSLLGGASHTLFEKLTA